MIRGAQIALVDAVVAVIVNTVAHFCNIDHALTGLATPRAGGRDVAERPVVAGRRMTLPTGQALIDSTGIPVIADYGRVDTALARYQLVGGAKVVVGALIEDQRTRVILIRERISI